MNKRVNNQRGADQPRQEKNGSLTKAQGNQLKANDRAIKQQEHAEVKANGGTLTKGEQKQLNQEENANSKLIHDEKHLPPASRSPVGRRPINADSVKEPRPKRRAPLFGTFRPLNFV